MSKNWYKNVQIFSRAEVEKMMFLLAGTLMRRAFFLAGKTRWRLKKFFFARQIDRKELRV